MLSPKKRYSLRRTGSRDIFAVQKWSYHPAVLTILIVSPLLVIFLILPGSTFLDRLRWLDSGICAQLLTHSFYPGGERLPLCARNTGLYLGFLLTWIILIASGRGKAQELPPVGMKGLLVGGLALLALDGFNSLLLDLCGWSFYVPHNILRLATGLLAGLSLAALMLPIINRQLWKTYNEEPSIASWSFLLKIFVVLLLCLCIIASQNSLIIYPIAILSTSGIVGAIGSLHLVLLITLSKRDETFVHYRELGWFIGLALTCTLVEMCLLASIKVWLFHFLPVFQS